MFEKNMRLAFLLDFYADVLDEHTRNIMRAYYHDDLSLAEIAEDEGISLNDKPVSLAINEIADGKISAYVDERI